ncbi:MAG: zf-HC2 domain-containing protein [Planctomycetaceae bacterium]
MANGSQQRDDWQECPPGTLQGYARRYKRSQQTQGLARASGAAAVVLAFAGLTWWSAGRWSGEREYHFGGIACSAVQSNIAAYAMGSLPEETTERIRAHLSECPVCQEMLRRMQPPVAPTASVKPAGSAVTVHSPMLVFR